MLLSMTYTWIYVSPKLPKRVAQKLHLAILRIEVTRASRGLSVIAELLVKITQKKESWLPKRCVRRGTFQLKDQELAWDLTYNKQKLL